MSDHPDDCRRCGKTIRTQGRGVRKNQCGECSESIWRQLARWLEDKPKPLAGGEAKEFAYQLEMTPGALYQRIRRFRKGVRRT